MSVSPKAPRKDGLERTSCIRDFMQPYTFCNKSANDSTNPRSKLLIVLHHFPAFRFFKYCIFFGSYSCRSLIYLFCFQNILQRPWFTDSGGPGHMQNSRRADPAGLPWRSPWGCQPLKYVIASSDEVRKEQTSRLLPLTVMRMGWF